MPPMPSATSRAIEPVGIAATWLTGLSPSRITEPLPNCLSICASARSSAFSRSGPAPIAATPGRFDVLPLGRLVTADTLGAGSDRIRAPRPKDDTRTSVRRWRDAPFRPGEEANALVTAAGGPPGRLPAGGGLRRYRAGRCGGGAGAAGGRAPSVVGQVGPR